MVSKTVDEIKSYMKKDINYLFDEKRLESLFSDVFVGNKGDINPLMFAYNEGIVKFLIDGSNDERLNQFSLKLISDYGLQREKAYETVELWNKILSKDIKQTYIDKLSDEQNKIVEEEKLKENNEKSEKKSNQIKPIEVKSLNYEEQYVNPKPIEKNSLIIPCGVGNSDCGFKILGIVNAEVCKHSHASIFALVYNFFLRNSRIEKSNYPIIFKKIESESKFAIDYKVVYRFIMILLCMIKNNYMSNDTLSIKLYDSKDEIKIALDIINYYFYLFCRLARVNSFRIKLTSNDNSPILSINNRRANIYTEDLDSFSTNARKMWFGKKINYKLDESNKKDLEILLKEISNFEHFKEGQFEALCNMISNRGHTMCIMPTGSGKSLIFYFASLLQPLSVIVVTPTEVLIQDQIRNLQKLHNYDNVAHLKLDDNNSFDNFEITNNLLYLTPMTFQSRNLFEKAFTFCGKNNQVAYVVLDEIHCLSHWGHDFRPEYLMLSNNLKKYFDTTTYLGFTATANFTVVEDIQKQLDIPVENITSPIQFEKYNVKYDFRAVENKNKMLETVKQICKDIVSRNERAIVFTKSDEKTDEVKAFIKEYIDYDVVAFTNKNINAYQQFASGEFKIIITNEELGIGINFPNVNATIHFGIPISKNEYVQEVGRAGRNNQRVTSYIIYLNDTTNNINPKLLMRETIIDNMSNILTEMDNDYSDAFHKLTNNMQTSDVLLEKIKDMLSDFDSNVTKDKVIFGYHCPLGLEKTTKQLLYIFYVVGYINDFYSLEIDENKEEIDIIVDIWSTNYDKSKFKKQIIDRMKQRAVAYYSNIANSKKAIVKTQDSESVEDILKVYVNWYYEKYLYHQKEEFLNFFEFLKSNVKCNSEKITDDIQDYYMLPFVEIKEDDEYFKNLTFDEIDEKINIGISKKKIINVERLNSAKYDYRYDYILLINYWKKDGRFDVNRLTRFWPHMSAHEKKLCVNTLFNVYKDCQDMGKWNLLKYINDNDNVLELDFNKSFEEIYINYKDYIYYGVQSYKYNKIFNKGA